MNLEAHERHFHEHSRYGYHDNPKGGLYTAAREGKPCPEARYRVPGVEYGSIEIPASPRYQEGIFDCLSRRASERRCGGMYWAQLSTILYKACRVTRSNIIDTPGGPFETVHHPYPEGGATGSLEVWPLIRKVHGYDALSPGLYHYDKWNHSMGMVSNWTIDCEMVRQSAIDATGGEASPDVVLIITCRFGRYRWKYSGISYRVALMACGALYQTLYLTATALGCSPCGIGSGNSAQFDRMAGLDPEHSAIGEFIIGGAPIG